MKKQNRKKGYKKKNGFGLIGFVVLLIFGVVTYQRLGLNAQRSECKTKIAELESQIEKEETRTEEIEQQKAYMKTKKYVEEVAREKLGLVYKDEIIFQAEEDSYNN